jgi:hypothetical protein
MSSEREVAQVDLANLPSPSSSSSSRVPHRVIPAIIGGVFAGLLLVGLGCTPFFKDKRSQAFAESGMIVHARGGPETVVDGGIVEGAAPASSADATAGASSSSSSSTPSGMPTIAASSAKRGGIAPSASGESSAHSFSINCNPTHSEEDQASPRPETVALQGIMAGRTSKTALLGGVLYREGDRFGSTTCPWTVAMIEPSRVRIEKAFGDRTCGVTINWQNKTAAAKSR